MKYWWPRSGLIFNLSEQIQDPNSDPDQKEMDPKYQCSIIPILIVILFTS